MIFFWMLISSCFFIVRGTNNCAPRSVNGESVVCVCNATYCDEVNRLKVSEGQYVTYTSSKTGLRFQTTTGNLICSSQTSGVTYSEEILIDSSQKFQTIIGFGGAVTDAAGINWKYMSEPLQQHLINSYFSETGLEYNMIRVPIGGSDFSTHAYAYNELPINDATLSNFSLSPEDHLYKIPMIKESLKVATEPIHIIATTWSPPVWMKTNGAISGSSRLKEEYYGAYADYHIKFIQQYAEEGISIWAITTTNEPINGIIPLAQFNSLGWMPASMAKWIEENLAPAIRNSAYRDTKILALDDQRFMIPLFFDTMVRNRPSVVQYIDGVAVHFYGDALTPASVLSSFSSEYKNKLIIASEASQGSLPWEFKGVILGSWKRAEIYIEDIIEDLTHSVAGWIDWNLCLNPQGGPNWANNVVDSAIIVTSPDEFIKQPMYYALGHFSKFVPRNSTRIQMENKNSRSCIKHVAFWTPDNTIVAILYNPCSATTALLRVYDKSIKVAMDSKSITTIELKS